MEFGLEKCAKIAFKRGKQVRSQNLVIDINKKYDNIIRRMRFACWITKTTDAHSEYVILVAFPRQQCLRDGATLLR